MADKQDIIINKLIGKLEQLYSRQADFNKEINSLKEELFRLKGEPLEENRIHQEFKETPQPKTVPQKTIVEKTSIEPVNQVVKSITKQKETTQKITTVAKDENVIKPTIAKSKAHELTSKLPKTKSSLEKFIGENLLNKIGIIITIIGVAIGAKYSIENELISPLTRIILGYVAAAGLLGFGIKLKEKYESYSAVLVSGSIVILYFITFFAYSFYDLIPQTFAFALMAIFTVFTVVAAISYNKQIIAHLGLVGAYAVPFLLSNNSGRVEVLFAYMAIINIGILVLSFKKYWKPLFYSSFVFTWLIFTSWLAIDFNINDHFTLGFTFVIVFFILFYITFLAYKMLRKEAYNEGDIVILFANSFIFYGLGFFILNEHDKGEQLLGLFTLSNALLHFIVTLIIYKQKLADKKLFYLASGLVLVFITITIPVQLNGNWVTLLWTVQAALLFWIGRTKSIAVYEKLSYPLMFLAFLSLIQDWGNTYDFYYGYGNEAHTPLLNSTFLTSAIFITIFSFIVILFRKKEYVSALTTGSKWKGFMSYSIPIILVSASYMAFRLEIEAFWQQLYYSTSVELSGENNGSYETKNYSLLYFETIWVVNYSLLFVSALWLLNARVVKNKVLNHVAIGLVILSVFSFLTIGLLTLSDLRTKYQTPPEYFDAGIMHLAIRYISFVFLALALYVCYRYSKQKGLKPILKTGFDILLHISILWVLSSELIHWMDMAASEQSYKLGLSILWGVYSFILIAFGIWKSKAYLRIGGMALFGITLIKLFFYDISHLNTISKTVVFLSLGVLLLIISFLYNKYKSRIADDFEE